uniref:Uncharacterized protein n=1 Tax=Anguilla anguilla TaxID=7936 RepID=A0A0E9VS95_ANGAN
MTADICVCVRVYRSEVNSGIHSLLTLEGRDRRVSSLF